MYGLYTPVLIFQFFCLYHAYRNRVEQRWYWLILFFPLGGSIIYLAYNFGNARSLGRIGETVKEVVNSNYRIEELQLALEHSDNITNRLNLADEYVRAKRFDDAIALYKKCLDGFMADDPSIKMKLLQAYFLKSEFDPIVPLAESLLNEKSFVNSEEMAAYGWALFHVGRSEDAQRVFEKLDKPYTNYKQRLEFCRYLHYIQDGNKLKEKLSELSSEFRFMKSSERRTYRNVIRSVEDLIATIQR